MVQFIHYVVILHVIAGSLALLFGAIAFGLRKRTPKHKPFGRAYFWCMTVIFVTGVFLSIVKGILFFFLIAVFTYYSTIVAYRALKLKNLHLGQKPEKLDWFIEIAAGITFIGMIIFGMVMFINTGNLGGSIPFVFGSFGLAGVYKNCKYFLKGPFKPNSWLKIHLGNMMGSYIGAITAFLVNQTDKIHINPLFLWFGPAAVIVPFIIRELKKVKTE